MELLNKILKWTESELTLWQRDAVRRLLQQEGALSEQDYEELYELFKLENQLLTTSSLQAIPLTSAHLPTIAKAGETVLLKELRDLKYVNRIASGQVLKFSPQGMTIIYGPNGSGKSGYGRVMKRACRARDQTEPIHPDVTDSSVRNRIPEAHFEVEIGGVAQSVKWISGHPSPDELSTVTVFDTRCARIYVTEESDIAYLPLGLDVLENLAQHVFPELRRRLDLEIESIHLDPRPFDHLTGSSEIGQIIASKAEAADIREIKRLSTVSASEQQRMQDLDQILSSADPKEKAQERRMSQQRLQELATRIESMLALVSDAAVSQIKALDEACQQAIRAEATAAQAFRAGETLLPGTGDHSWKLLFDAARRFSTEVAYPQHKFPHTDEGALCPLCQQPLDEGAARLQRFETYIQEDAARHAKQKRWELTTAQNRLEQKHLTLGLDDSLAMELSQLDATLIARLKAFEASLQHRQKSLLEALKLHSWDSIPTLSENPYQRVKDLATSQLAAAQSFEQAADETNKVQLNSEHENLTTRQKLSECLDAVLEWIDRSKAKQALEECKPQFNTLRISNKSKELADQEVTEALKAALNEEFEAIGIGHIQTKLRRRTEYGKTLHQLLLDFPNEKKLEEVLSEGEQRAIAIGSFLAELQLANHSGSLIFDDPVSSLDHWRRQMVAKRLVNEAKQRQVVVFTHDTSFLGQLQDEIHSASICHAIQYLEHQNQIPGHVFNGLPWEHKGYKDRIKVLKQKQREIAQLPGANSPYFEHKNTIRKHYGFLRATIERVVQDVVFNGVVRRYRDWIRFGGLEATVGFQMEEYTELARLYKRCSEVIEAHDPSSDKNPTAPTARELGHDITALESWVTQIKARQNQQMKDEQQHLANLRVDL